MNFRPIWCGPVSRRWLAACLLVLGACSPFPGVEVAFTPPNQSALSDLIRDNWMSVDRGIAEAVRQLVRQRLGPGSARMERPELEALGFACEPLPSTQCTHSSTARTRPVGPQPVAGSQARLFKVQVSATAGASLDSIKVTKTSE